MSKVRFIRLPKVMERIGYSKSNIYKLMATGLFPRPIQLGARAVAWIDEEVEAWIRERITVSRLNPAHEPPSGEIVNQRSMARSIKRKGGERSHCQ